MAEIRRLHIGAKHLVEIPKVSWLMLSQENWIHLGTEQLGLSPIQHDANNKNKNREAAKMSCLKKLTRLLINRHGIREEKFPQIGDVNRSDPSIWQNAELIPWYYRKGDTLPFGDQTFTFVYSEHFFEHLFIDEAIYLFREVCRVMDKGAVCRTVVPDADLRTYEPPEPAGYPDENMAWDNPEKHKTRWSFSVLDEILGISGFDSRVGLAYCTQDGKLINRTPEECRHEYSGSTDTEAVFDVSYIARPSSLIVDAVKA